LAGSTELPTFTSRDLTRVGGRKLRPPFAPMEVLSVDEIPSGSDWQYEPEWDGFRCLVFRNSAFGRGSRWPTGGSTFCVAYAIFKRANSELPH